MSAVLTGKARDEYNKTVYARKWLDSSAARLGTDYYAKDHHRDTLEALIGAAGARVLECGIGTGEYFALGLARAGKDVFGIDFSEMLLRDCRRRFAREGFSARLGMADAHTLPFRGGSFDAVYAIGVMPYMKDLRLVVREMVRVTKVGGVIIFDVMNLWHVSQFINYWYCVVESSAFGFRLIDALKRFKRSLGLTTNFKGTREKVNYRLLSPLAVRAALRGCPGKVTVRGYNVLLPLNLPVVGRHANLCERVPLFARGLKDNGVLKYFGAKLVVTIEKR